MDQSGKQFYIIASLLNEGTDLVTYVGRVGRIRHLKNFKRLKDKEAWLAFSLGLLHQWEF